MTDPMSSRADETSDVRAAIVETLGRDLSTATVMLHTAVADRVGLRATDHKAYDVLLRHGPMTAGRLAEWLGFTSAAATGVIDRLEEQGYVRRETDPQDRRKVIVAPLRERAAAIYALLQPLALEVADSLEGYSDEEARAIHDFLSQVVRTLDALTASIRAGDGE